MMDKKVRYSVVDLETNILNKTIGKNKASPFYKKNEIVLGAFTNVHQATKVTLISNEYSDDVNLHRVQQLFKHEMLVGHNIKFDLLYLRRFYNSEYLKWYNNGGIVWDTQIAEYLLSGQTATFPSLDYTSLQYGGTLKDDKIKEYWKMDTDTADIPRGELLDYLIADVENTELIFEKQYEKVVEEGMLPIVMSQMDALLALVEIEFNGMKFDRKGAVKERDDLSYTLEAVEKNIVDTLKAKLPTNMTVDVSAGSNKQLSTVLFGGDVKIKTDVPVLDGNGVVVRFKSGIRKGQVKTKRVEDKVFIHGYNLTPIGKKMRSGIYPVDDASLNKLLEEIGPSYVSECSFIRSVLYYRKLAKDISTYYDGLLALLFTDDYIHPNYNQCATVTGRLSSSSPNGQNISGKKDD